MEWLAGRQEGKVASSDARRGLLVWVRLDSEGNTFAPMVGAW